MHRGVASTASVVNDPKRTLRGFTRIRSAIGSFELRVLTSSFSEQHTNRISGWSALGKLSPAPRRKQVHLRRQAGRYACLVRNRRAAQHQGVTHAGGAPCCGFLELRKCSGRKRADEQASRCNHSASNSDHYDLPKDGHTLFVIGPVLPLESCDGHHVFSFFLGGAGQHSNRCERQRHQKEQTQQCRHH
jgi:hypothetical protein